MSQSNLIHKTGSLRETQARKGLTFAEAFLSVEAIVVVDISASMNQKDVAGEGGMCSRWDEAGRQLQRLQHRFPGRLAVVAFSDNAEFCPDGQLPHVKGGTNLYGALEFIAPADGCGIRIIVASDGEPDDPASALALAQKMESKIDAIYIGSSDCGRRFMRELAKASGGKSLDISVLELEDKITRLLTEGLRNTRE